MSTKAKRQRKAQNDEQLEDDEERGEQGISLAQLHEIVKRRKIERETQNVDENRARNVDAINDLTVEDGNEENEKDCPTQDDVDEGLPVLTQHESKGKVVPLKYQPPSWVTDYHPLEEDIATNSVPLESFNIRKTLISNLCEMGICNLFPVQAAIVPKLIESSKGPLLTQSNGIAPSDICVCAPTGCGKTLTYVIPIVNALMSSTICRLCALVIVPSQDLALQVRSVFKDVSKGTLVKTGIFCGQSTLNDEIEGVLSPLGSKVDILVSTPGRLVSHLQRCELLSFRDLRYLVIDEADRIFEQYFHNWLDVVTDAMQRPSSVDATTSLFASSSVPFLFPSLFKALPKLNPAQTSSHNPSPFSSTIRLSDVFSPKQPLQKLLFSATLSLDPEKLSLLRLYNPKLYSVSPAVSENVGEAVLPSTLSEHMLVCKSDHKPILLLYVLCNLEKDNSVLCFTHSKFSTHRLKLVLQQYQISVGEVSANVPQETRRSIVKKFNTGKIKVLVCTDAMSRGMDIPSVQCVINYDVPAHFKSYLHRVGRTARAGAKGDAYTILTHDEVSNFTRIVRNARRNKIERINVSDKDIKPYLKTYSQALENVAAIVEQ